MKNQTSTPRAVIIFFALSLALIFSVTSSIYAGYQSGELQNRIIEPMTKTITDFSRSIDEALENAFESQVYRVGEQMQENQSTQTPKPTIYHIRNSVGSGIQYEVPQMQYAYPTNADNYEDSLHKLNEWFRNEQEENIARSEESRKGLEEFQRQSEDSLRQFDQEGQKGLEEFRQEQQKKQSEFKKEHGIE